MKSLTTFGLVVAISILAANELWYRVLVPPYVSVKKVSHPVGIVYSALEDDLRRKSLERQIWQPLSSGETIFVGDSLRVGFPADIRILLEESKKELRLEPNSVLHLAKVDSDGRLLMELEKGGLWIGNEKGSLLVQTPAGVLDLSLASGNLFKTDDNSELQFLLHGGAANIISSQGTRPIAIGRTTSLTIQGVKETQHLVLLTQPNPQKPVYINGDATSLIKLGYSSALTDGVLSLWTGRERKQLKSVYSGPISKDALSATFDSGINFVKIQIRHPAGVADSETYSLLSVVRSPPTLLMPEDSALRSKDREHYFVVFKWESPENIGQHIFELSRDANFKNLIATKYTNRDISQTLELPEGEYFWRVGGYYPNETTPNYSRSNRFNIVSPRQFALIQNAKPKIDINIKWKTNDSTIFYADHPAVTLAWETDKKELVKQWRLRNAPSEAELENSVPIVTPDLSSSIAFGKPGRYLVLLEALDEKSTVLAKLGPRTLELRQAPKLAAPRILPEGRMLIANSEGAAQLNWSKVEGATEYILTIVEGGGQKRTKRSQKESTTIVNLQPGEATVQIAAIDRFGRESEKSPIRNIQVPDAPALEIPLVLKVEVK